MPSADLLETIYQAQQRQEWFRQYAAANGLRAADFVGSSRQTDSIEEVAEGIRNSLDYGVTVRGSSWSDALRVLSENAESVGVLVMISGIVGSNTRRVLDPDEFRGFSLVDRYAPTIFVNGSDTKAAQIFTLAHELAHLWLGESGLDNPNLGIRSDLAVERWCNAVAAEFLVPEPQFRRHYRRASSLTAELDRLAGTFRVSTLVILRRLLELDYVGREQFFTEYHAEVARISRLRPARAGGGGNFYNTQPVRASKTFARALISDTLAGGTSYTDAFRMLGIRKSSTLLQLADRLEVA